LTQQAIRGTWLPVPSISADGRFVAFNSDASNIVPGDTNMSRHLRAGQAHQYHHRVSVDSAGNQGNMAPVPSISADGRFVAFNSSASNLVPGDTNMSRDSSCGTRSPIPPPACQ
jgi:Tol biopolymer transport system component